MLPIACELSRLAADAPDRPAIWHVRTDRVEGFSYQWLMHSAFGCSRRLRQAVAPGEVIILSSSNRPHYFAWLWGAWIAGVKAFVMSASVTPAETDRAVRASGARVWVGDNRTPPPCSFINFEDLQQSDTPCSQEGVDELETGILLQSSGTTGEPKIVFRNARAVAAMASSLRVAIPCGAKDRVLACVPVTHSYGIEHVALLPLTSGASVELQDGFDVPRVESAIARGATLLPGVPFMFDMMSQLAQCDAGTLRLVYSAGAMLPRSVFDSFDRVFGLKLGQVYGASELGSLTFNDPSQSWFNPASVGRPLDQVSLRVLPRDFSSNHEGEIAAAAPSMLARYVGPDAPLLASQLIDGHLPTGDLGKFNGDGTLELTGRLKLMIDIGGLKVNPIEIESTFREHPQVRDAVVVAVSLSPTVQRLRAVIEPLPGVSHEQLDAAALRAWARERLSSHKVPRVIEICAALPRTQTGKVIRKKIEESSS